uniref:Uncharacterized protein n=1 Tax=Parascaris univalens TaxID=6257 RepID=A0A915ARP1_PARUN
MLGKLVNKFKKHSLQESPAALVASTTTQPQPFRRSARISALYSENSSTLHDSGTESDDDELEQLDSMSNASLGAHPGDVMGSSPPNLTSSPPLISDFDTNSWDSTGCESGIVMRDRSEEPSESSRDNVFDHTMTGNRVLMSFSDAGNTDGVEAAGGRTDADSGTAETGAFRPVTRRRSLLHENQDTTTVFGTNVTFNSSHSPLSQGTIGEKRRYDNMTPKSRFGNDSDTQQSPIATRLRSYNNANTGSEQRETLIAARRQPVKLIIHNPGGLRRASQPLAAPAGIHKGTSFGIQPESPPYHPLKRGRLNTSGRPCLDFEKMRERMVICGACGIGSQEFVESAIGERDIEKRRHDWALNMSTSGGRRCAQHQVLRCQQSDCAFGSLDVDNATSAGSLFSKEDA